MKKSNFIKDAFILCAITLISGIALGSVYGITKDPIAKAQESAKQEAYKQVFSNASEFKANDDETALIASTADEILQQGFGSVGVDEIVDALDTDGSVLGYVVTATSKEGYGGDVQVSVGIMKDGTVNGIAFLTLAETAGLGMNAKNPEFYEQYSNKKVDQFSVTKTGSTKDSEINALSGATITSRAVTGAVNAALYFVNNCLAQ